MLTVTCPVCQSQAQLAPPLAEHYLCPECRASVSVRSAARHRLATTPALSARDSFGAGFRGTFGVLFALFWVLVVVLVVAVAVIMGINTILGATK